MKNAFSIGMRNPQLSEGLNFDLKTRNSKNNYQGKIQNISFKFIWIIPIFMNYFANYMI